MDKANAALATYLLDRGHIVHLVAHSVEPVLRRHSRACVTLVGKPANSFFLGQFLLNHIGQRVARGVRAQAPGARVVVNGGVCAWHDINWAHCVHHAWDQACPIALRPIRSWAKHWLHRTLAKRQEKSVIPRARVVIANSERTKRDLETHLGVDARRIHVVRLGTEGGWSPPTAEERRDSRASFQQSPDRPLAVFVGALDRDDHKGLATLYRAWKSLCQTSTWDVDLIVAGGGNALASWRRTLEHDDFSHRVRFIGFIDDIPRLLAAADLLVSPARYESFGLNVQEAICRGVPAIVSASAGVAELYPAELSAMLLPDPDDADDLSARLRAWRGKLEAWRRAFAPFSTRLRAYTWRDCAAALVEAVECSESVVTPAQ